MSEQDNLQEQQLQSALLTNYLANLAFLSEYDNELYQKIETLSKMLEDGTYEEKYRLEFVKEDGDFDVFDVKNNVYLYDRTPKIYNRKLINNIDFNGKQSIKSLEENLYKTGFTRLKKEESQKLKMNLQDSLPSLQLLRNDVSEYIEIFNKNLEYKKIKKIEKFIFFGTLLGRHINPIAEKVDAQTYFVCEKNLELFRLSLFVNDYKNLAKNKGVVFSIMEGEEETNNKINIFLEFNPFSNYLLKFSSTSINVQEYIEYFLTSLVFRKPTTFAYNRVLYTIVRNLSEKINKYKFISFKNENENGFFDDIPVLFLAAGPSLQENLEWVKENQKDFFIVAVGASYKTLIKYGIKVDMIITLDASYEVLNEKQFSVEDVDKYIKDTIVLCSAMTDKRILDRFSQDKLFMFGVGHSFFGDEKPLPSYSVGEKSVDLLLSMGVKELYIIGLDLALNQETGDSHSASNDSVSKKYELDNTDFSKFGFNTGIIKIKGNFYEEVRTTSRFKASKNCLDFIISKRKTENTNIYNLSIHGAFFENTIPLKAEEIEIEKLSNMSLDDSKIVSFFNDNSLLALDDDSIKRLEEEISTIKKIPLDINKEFDSYDEFYNEIANVVNIICFKNETATFLPSMFKNYFVIVLSYLSSQFNDKNIKKEKIKVNKVKKVFYSQVKCLLDDYVSYLEGIKKPKS